MTARKTKRKSKRHIKGRVGKRLKFMIVQDANNKFGPSAVLLDSRGRSINVINGGSLDSPGYLRQLAKEHWNADERTTLPPRWGGYPLVTEQ